MACLLAFLLSNCQSQGGPDDYVNAHNNACSEVGVPLMVWNDTVAAYAQSYANNRSADCLLQHSDTNNYGENIFVGTGNGNYSGVDAVNAWAAEKQYYDYASNSCTQGQTCGHYSQVVWNTSTNVGCARVICNSGSIFITCNYYLPGNVVGQRPY